MVSVSADKPATAKTFGAAPSRNGACFVQSGKNGQELAALFLAETGDRLAQLLVREGVGAVDDHRDEAALELVLAFEHPPRRA